MRPGERPRRAKGRWRDCGPSSLGAVVVIVTVAVEALVLLGVMEAGEAAQVVCAGKPAQPKLTAWLKPLSGAIESVNVAVPPTLTVADC